MHRTDHRAVNVAQGRYLAAHIEGSKYVELAGEDQLLYTGDADALVDQVEEFLDEAPEARSPIASVMADHTVIVGLHQRAGSLGRPRLA